MASLISERVEAAREGRNPTVICRMPSGWAVLGDVQFLRGYSILLADPVVEDLNALDEGRRARFFLDMAIIGDALLEATGAYRINYEILGNTDAVLHAHLFPRYMAEPEEYRKGPAWLYDREFRLSTKFDADRDRELMDRIAEAIGRRLSAGGGGRGIESQAGAGGMEINLRRAGPEDAARLRRIDTVVPKDPSRGKMIAEWLRKDTVVAAEAKGDIIGYGVLNEGFFRRPQVEMLMVAESSRGMGAGNRILEALETSANAEMLFVATNLSNRPMQRLLARRGYRPCGFVDELDPGDPELIFSKRLKEGGR